MLNHVTVNGKKNDDNIVIFTWVCQEQKTILSNGHIQNVRDTLFSKINLGFSMAIFKKVTKRL